MRKILSYQNNFTKGELDSSLWGHGEQAAYYEALASAENVWITATGSVAKRYGLNQVTSFNSKTSKMFSFSNISGTHFLLVLLPGKLTIIDSDSDTTVAVLVVEDFTESRIQNIYGLSCQDSVIFTHSEFPPKQLKWKVGNIFENSDIVCKNIPTFEFSINDEHPNGTLTPTGDTGFITVTSSVDSFSSADVGKYITMLPIGRLRITSYNGVRTVGGYLEENLFDKNAIASGDWTIERGWLPLWGSGNGYPSVSGFHEGRLLFGNFPRAKSVFAYSVINSPFDFTIGDGTTAYGGWKILSYDQRNDIRHITSEHALYIFCGNGEFSIDQSSGEDLRKASINHDTAIGSVKTIRPLMSDDGGLYFFQNNSTGLSEFRYYFERGSHSVDKISKYAGHLIALPISATMWKGDADFEANILFFVNSDGTMVCATINMNEKILAFTRVVTEKRFSGVCNVNNTIYATAVDGEVTYLLRFKSGIYSDIGQPYESSITMLPISNESSTFCMSDISIINVYAYISDTSYLTVNDVVIYNGQPTTTKVKKYYTNGWHGDGMVKLSDGGGISKWQINNVCREAMIGGNL